jgi:hypothetical protein
MVYFQSMNYLEDCPFIDVSDICIICHEFDNNTNEIPYAISHFSFFKNCKCDCYIHKSCLNMWYFKHLKCPICRNTMIRAPIYTRFISLDAYLLDYYLHLTFFLRLLTNLAMFYVLVDQYLSLFRIKNFIDDYRTIEYSSEQILS